jgi:hypothetical protein
VREGPAVESRPQTGPPVRASLARMGLGDVQMRMTKMSTAGARRAVLIASLGAALLAAAAPAARAAAEDENAYMARCQRQTISAFKTPAAQALSICATNWDMILAAGPMADALLAAAPATGAKFDLAAARANLTAVKWQARAAKGQEASGSLGAPSAGEITAGLVRTPAPGLTLSWFRQGEPIPFRLEDAIAVRGARIAMVGCLSFGAAESYAVYRVEAPGKAPFALTVNKREAAVANQASDFAASADYSGAVPSLAKLRADGSEWQAVCGGG